MWGRPPRNASRRARRRDLSRAQERLDGTRTQRLDRSASESARRSGSEHKESPMQARTVPCLVARSDILAVGRVAQGVLLGRMPYPGSCGRADSTWEPPRLEWARGLPSVGDRSGRLGSRSPTTPLGQRLSFGDAVVAFGRRFLAARRGMSFLGRVSAQAPSFAVYRSEGSAMPTVRGKRFGIPPQGVPRRSA